MQEVTEQLFFGPTQTGTKPKVVTVPGKPQDKPKVVTALGKPQDKPKVVTALGKSQDKVRGKYFRKHPVVS